jgi:bisphosphoglycerate-dependent phosphoglycerate mutase
MIARAIQNLTTSSEWNVENGVLYWRDTEQTQPTEAEITAEVARLQAEYDNNKYQRQRAQAYPSIADQLDKIYHEGIDAWKAQIAAVKQEYPKP